MPSWQITLLMIKLQLVLCSPSCSFIVRYQNGVGFCILSLSPLQHRIAWNASVFEMEIVRMSAFTNIEGIEWYIPFEWTLVHITYKGMVEHPVHTLIFLLLAVSRFIVHEVLCCAQTRPIHHQHNMIDYKQFRVHDRDSRNDHCAVPTVVDCGCQKKKNTRRLWCPALLCAKKKKKTGPME